MKAFMLALSLIFVQPATATEITLTLVSQNLNRLFDDRDDGNKEKILSHKKYLRRMKRVANKIAGNWKLPDIIAVQEVENLEILHDISRQVIRKTGIHYRPILIEGNDISGIDVGFLVKQGIRLGRIEALFHNSSWRDHQSPLFSRPPLRIDVCKTRCVTVVNVHLRSMRGINSGSRTNYVRQKRNQQSQMLARWINRFQQNNPHRALMIIGDFNALTPSDHYVDVMGTIIGQPDPQRPRVKSTDLIEQDLIDASARLAPSQRVTYRFHRRNQQLDYLLLSHSLEHSIEQISFTKIDYKFSDHAALIARIALSPVQNH
jgi:endonuclease/exonuclease/phosphatase family metal-dependent hydrolase